MQNSTLAPSGAGSGLRALYDLLMNNPSALSAQASVGSAIPNGGQLVGNSVKGLDGLKQEQAAAQRRLDPSFIAGATKAAQAEQRAVAPQPAAPQANVMAAPTKGAMTGPADDGSSTLAALGGTMSIPKEKVGAKPDINAMIDQSIVDTMSAQPEAAPNLFPEESKQKLDSLMQPKPAPTYKKGSELDVPGVSGFRRFLGYSKTGDWRDADKKELEFQIMRAAADRGDQSFTPQELEQLKMLQGDREANRKNQAELSSQREQARIGAQGALQNTRLRNQGQMDEAMAKLTAELGGDSKLAEKMMLSFPDLFGSEQVEAKTGMAVDPRVLSAIAEGRIRAPASSNAMDEILADYLEQTLSAKSPEFKAARAAKKQGQQQPQQAAPANSGNFNLKALGK